METLEGFPNLPAMVRAEQSSAAPHAFAARPSLNLVRLMNNAGQPSESSRRSRLTVA
jgi:hypothetical protein